MNFTCNRELLQKCVVNAERVTGKNLSLPILSSVFLATSNKSLIIRATNLEVGVELQIPADIKTEGNIAIPGALLSSILNNIPDEENITVIANNGVCKIITKSKNITIKGFVPDDFPTIPNITDEESFTLSTSKFLQGVKSVLMSAAVSDVKPEISSVYIYKDTKAIVFVATDSFRLAEKRIEYNNDKVFTGLIVPIKNIIELVKIFENTNEELFFKITKTQISCVGKNIYATSRAIQGIYPDYQQIIPKKHTTEIVVLKQDLLNAIKLSTLFSDKFNKIQINIDPTNKKCIVSTKNSDIGETETSLSATISGDPIETLLNGKHLFDCLGGIERDSLVLEFNESNKPVVIKGLGDPSYTYLTMPLTK
ncbi:MAG: DNA polymerase III subunit beta [Candidatus Paceibacterota bacterium]|jgi:DNA polymerase-3 subunit beta